MTDDGRRTHWQGEDGRLLHPITNLSRPPRTSGDEDEVDCQRCLHFLAQVKPDRITEVSATVDAGLTQGDLDGMNEAERLALVVGAAYGKALAERDEYAAQVASLNAQLARIEAACAQVLDLDVLKNLTWAHDEAAVDHLREAVGSVQAPETEKD